MDEIRWFGKYKLVGYRENTNEFILVLMGGQFALSRQEFKLFLTNMRRARDYAQSRKT